MDLLDTPHPARYIGASVQRRSGNTDPQHVARDEIGNERSESTDFCIEVMRNAGYGVLGGQVCERTWKR